MKPGTRTALVLAAAILALAALPAFAHCDAEDGPVIIDARVALERGEVAPVLKWIPASHEAEIRALFSRVVRVREGGDDAKAVADALFFETLVRLHRESEGAPFDGIKPAGIQDPMIVRVDAALREGRGEALADAVGAHFRQEVASRFAAAAKAAETRDASPEEGRAWVATYVDLVHFVMAVHDVMHAEHAHAGGK